MNGTIQLPSECIEQTAESVASRHKSIAVLWFWALGLFAFGGVAMAAEGKEDASTVVVGIGFWVVLFGILAVRTLRKAWRARRSGQASLDRSLQWFLDGKTIVAADARGIPQPELAFKITGKLRTALTAVPRAQALVR